MINVLHNYMKSENLGEQIVIMSNSHWLSSNSHLIVIMQENLKYCISGNTGDELNLAAWRLRLEPPK